jgi:Transposase domain (DUF772)
MRPTKRQDRGQQDLLRSRLDQIVDPAHALVRMARAIDWDFLEGKLDAAYTDGPAQPPLPTRLMAGLAILKHMHNLSDEALCDRWLENPYYPETAVAIAGAGTDAEVGAGQDVGDPDGRCASADHGWPAPSFCRATPNSSRIRRCCFRC